ncbi:MAG: SprT family protein [Firmicutes bacterium]|nr:SprT family protein [Bacillota bacterium]
MNATPSVPETDEALTALARTLSRHAFGRAFDHACRYNTRLRAVAGRYLLATHDIEISVTHVKRYGFDELKGTLLHELCHYHLHLLGRGYRHRDQDFKQLLKAVGGSRYAKPGTQAVYRYVYCCTSCARRYERRRKIDTKRYVCGHCRGILQLDADLVLSHQRPREE